MLGKDITKFCYPRGRYNEQVIEVVKEVGFTEARTTIVLKTEYPNDLFRTDTTIHCFARKEYDGADWLNVAIDFFTIAKEKGHKGYFHVWGHAQELQDKDEWAKFEKLLIYLKENK